MIRNYCSLAFIALFTSAFSVAYAIADNIPTDNPAAKEQPPLSVLAAHVDVSPLGYTLFDIEFRANQRITGWEAEFKGHPKIGTAMPIDSPWEKGRTYSWSYTWDTARSIKTFKCSIISIQVPTGSGSVKQIILDTPIAFEAKLVERRAFRGKLDMPRLKDASVRTTVEVIAFFEKDGTYKAKENRVYTMKELRSVLGEPKNINQGIAGRTPMPQLIPPGFDGDRIKAHVDALNASFPGRCLFLNYACRDGTATAGLNQLDYHGDNAINDAIRLQIHTVQVVPGEKQSEKRSPAER